jgi:two-component system phosphate regulon sensor histidine kinase PhoR
MSRESATRGSLFRRLAIPITLVQILVSIGAVWVFVAFVDSPNRPAVFLTAATAIAILLAATLITIRLVSRRLGRQVRRLATGAECLAQGDLSHRFEQGLPGVLRELSDSLNRVAEYQGERIRQLGLQQSEMQGILHAMSTGVIAMGRDGRVISMNPAVLHMLSLGEMDVRGRSLDEIGVDVEFIRFAEKVISSNGHGLAELSLDSPGGQRIVVRSEAIHDGQDSFVGVVLVLDNVTRLRQLEQVRVDFAANVSHELRTPITSIHGYAELLAEEQDESERRRYAEIVLKNAARLSSIIEDLLSLARLEDPAEAELPERETVQIHELLDEVVRACAAEAEPGNVTLKIECHEQIECHGSRQLLVQAVGNLVVNAIRYGPEDSTVVLSAGAIAEGEIQISVSDCGPGIDPSQRDRIFERFYRVDRGRSREVGGTGLGLAIVKHIALAHGGRVDLDSDVGHGSVFSIRLPVPAPERDLSAPLIRS